MFGGINTWAEMSESTTFMTRRRKSEIHEARQKVTIRQPVECDRNTQHFEIKLARIEPSPTIFHAPSEEKHASEEKDHRTQRNVMRGGQNSARHSASPFTTSGQKRSKHLKQYCTAYLTAHVPARNRVIIGRVHPSASRVYPRHIPSVIHHPFLQQVVTKGRKATKGKEQGRISLVERVGHTPTLPSTR